MQEQPANQSAIVGSPAPKVDREAGGKHYPILTLVSQAKHVILMFVLDPGITTPCPKHRSSHNMPTLGFTIYTNFVHQTSTGTLHQLSFWICSPQSSPDPDEDSRVPNGVFAKDFGKRMNVSIEQYARPTEF